MILKYSYTSLVYFVSLLLLSLIVGVGSIRTAATMLNLDCLAALVGTVIVKFGGDNTLNIDTSYLSTQR